MKIVIYSVFGGFACTTFENYCHYPIDNSKVKYYYKKDGFNTYLDVLFSIDNYQNIDFEFH